MILVRLSRFRETSDSLLGFLLCQSLVEKDHNLLIVTDAEEEDEIEAEKAAAKDLTKVYKYLGQARIASLKDISSKFQKIDTIIGVEPKMIDSALSLKANFNCRMIIATSARLDEETVTHLTEKIDELWSIGPELYDDHQNIIPKTSKMVHKCFVLFPNWALFSEEKKASHHSNRIRKVVSVWNQSQEYTLDEKRHQVEGSSLQDFETVLNAISEVNKRTLEFRIQWFVYGLKDRSSELFKALCREHANPELIEHPHNLQAILSDCSLFIVPDQNEDCHNIFGLSAILKRIPFVVPSTSSMGRLLRKFGYTSKDTIVTLTDSPQLGELTWTSMIVSILNTDGTAKDIRIPNLHHKLSCYIPQEIDNDMLVIKSPCPVYREEVKIWKWRESDTQQSVKAPGATKSWAVTPVLQETGSTAENVWPQGLRRRRFTGSWDGTQGPIEESPSHLNRPWSLESVFGTPPEHSFVIDLNLPKDDKDFLSVIPNKYHTGTEPEDLMKKSTEDITNFQSRVSPLLDIATASLQEKLDIVRLIKGRSCTIQGPDSDTLLNIPEGVYAVLLGNIHRNPSKFHHHIPGKDCLVAPICEYNLVPFSGKSLPMGTVYKLQIPHILRDVSQVRKHIRVRHGDLHGNAMLPVYRLQEDKFEIDEKYVTIYAKHFSGFIITAEAINCCSGRANVLVFGSMSNSSDMGSLVTVRMYFSSLHSEIKDYISSLERKLKRCKMSLELLKMREVHLSDDTYDASDSTVTVKLKPVDISRWTKFDGIPIHLEKQLNVALQFVDSHICKSEPTELAEFVVQSSQQSEVFRGVVDVDLNIVKSIQTNGPKNPVTNEPFHHHIVVELKDEPNQLAESVEAQGPDDLQMKELSKLASKIGKISMKRIAIEFFEMDSDEISNLSDEFRNPWDFNFEVLKKWRKIPGENNRSKLVDLMRKAARESLVNPHVVVEMLQVP